MNRSKNSCSFIGKHNRTSTYTGTETNANVNTANSFAVTLTAKWNANAMQTYNCANLDSGKTITLNDVRDNNTYTIAKLADGKCWMTQNLKIINKALTSTWSDTNGSYTVPASSLSGFNTQNTSYAYVGARGGYYSWYTATAGTGTTSVSSGNTSYSICPKNWRLPTASEFSTLAAKYSNSRSAMMSSPVNFMQDGHVDGGSLNHVGTDVHYLSSTAASSTTAYGFFLDTSNITPQFSDLKYYGFSVRCIAR